MRVLSLFDGISAGLVALKRIGIEVSEYHAYEIDPHAITISQKNHPEIIRHGSVVGADFTQFQGFDLIVAGSPCQGFSFAGHQLNFDDPRSALFFEFVRAIKEAQPKYFLLENVKMKKEYSDVISKCLGVGFVEINSALVSAQNRKRLYWTNLGKIEQPEDKGIYLKDIIESGLVDRDKSYCIDANYFKGGSLKNYLEKCRRQLVFNYSSSGRGNGKVEDRTNEALKAATLTATGYSNRSLTGVIDYPSLEIRKLTPIECERLQNFEDDYTEGISNSQRYKCLGNSWTVDVICHILKDLPWKLL
jgi:DNA-cytosine methyltransferase